MASKRTRSSTASNETNPLSKKTRTRNTAATNGDTDDHPPALEHAPESNGHGNGDNDSTDDESSHRSSSSRQKKTTNSNGKGVKREARVKKELVKREPNSDDDNDTGDDSDSSSSSSAAASSSSSTTRRSTRVKAEKSISVKTEKKSKPNKKKSSSAAAAAAASPSLVKQEAQSDSDNNSDTESSDSKRSPAASSSSSSIESPVKAKKRASSRKKTGKKKDESSNDDEEKEEEESDSLVSKKTTKKGEKKEEKKMRKARPGAWVFQPVAATLARRLVVTPARPIPKEALKPLLALRSIQGMNGLLKYSRPLADFKPGVTILATNKMQTDYEYVLSAPAGEEFAAGFTPKYTPGEMLKMGVFEGHYLNDCILEFPREWYEDALAADKLRPAGADIKINAFESKSRQPLQEWQRKGWITADSDDNRGWFQWYCRYWIGRRCDDDERQIRRWRAFKRHEAQIRIHCKPNEITARRRQRQGLLQWSYDGFI